MVLSQHLAAKACRNQKSLSPNQPVNFKYPKREYKDSSRSFKSHKRWKWLHYNEQKDSEYNLLRILACSSTSYDAKYENR